MPEHTFRITLTTQPGELPLDVDAIREGIATFIEEYYGTTYDLDEWALHSALVSGIVVDNRKYNPEVGVLEETSLPLEAMEHILAGRHIMGIKATRESTNMSLMEAKTLCDAYRDDNIEEIRSRRKLTY